MNDFEGTPKHYVDCGGRLFKTGKLNGIGNLILIRTADGQTREVAPLDIELSDLTEISPSEIEAARNLCKEKTGESEGESKYYIDGKGNFYRLNKLNGTGDFVLRHISTGREVNVFPFQVELSDLIELTRNEFLALLD